MSLYRGLGYRVVLTSAVTSVGIDIFTQAIQGRLSVLVGKSGVGKTSLLNAIQPGLGLRINEVSSATGKGKHTTSHLEMFPLEAGAASSTLQECASLGCGTAPMMADWPACLWRCEPTLAPAALVWIARTLMSQVV